MTNDALLALFDEYDAQGPCGCAESDLLRGVLTLLLESGELDHARAVAYGALALSRKKRGEVPA